MVVVLVAVGYLGTKRSVNETLLSYSWLNYPDRRTSAHP